MSFQAKPTGGVYRVKVYNSGSDKYWKYVADSSRWIQLTTVDENDEKFNWQIDAVPGSPNVFTIRPADSLRIGFGSTGPENAGKYWGYGFAQGLVGNSANWQIASPNGQYSKIKINNSPTGYALDCRDTSAFCVHFYQDQDVPAASNQRWVFQPVY